MGGDGLIGAVAGELRHTDGVLAVLPGGRGNDFARKLGLGSDPVAACDVLARGARAAHRRRRRQRPRLPRDRELGPRLRRRRPRQRHAPASSASSSTSTRTLRAVRAWRPARWEVVIDGEPRSFTGYSVAVANSGVFGGGMYLAPDAKLDDGLLDVVMIGDIPKRTYLGSLPKVFTGAHVREPGVEIVPGPRGRLPRRPPVQRAGRRRPDRRPPRHRARPARCAARHGPVSLLAPKLAAAKAVGALARRAGRGGGTSLPGKVLTRLEPHAIGLLAGAPRARQRRRSRPPTARRRRPRWWPRSSSAPARRLVHNRAGANMAGGVASALAAASRRGGRALDGDLGLFEVDEFWLGAGGRGAQAARAAAREPVPRPARPLRRARHDRRPLGRRRRRARRRARSSCSTPTTRSSPTSARKDGARCTSASRTTRVAHAELQHASDSKHCRRCGHAYVYEAAYMGHLGRYHCPQLRQPPPRARGGGRVGAAARHPLRRLHAAHAARARPASSCRCPGLYNVYNALGAAALCLSLGVELPTIAAGLGAVEPAFGRAETIDLDGRPTSILLVKNPAGANEVLRTLALEGGELDLFGVLNDRIADGRDVSWVWDADWETLAPHVARMTCSGTRAAELALRLKYAGVPTDRLHVVEDLATGLDHALAQRRAAAPLYALPTYTALLELRDLLSERGAGPGVLAMSAIIWHDVECGAYAADLPLWRELAATEAGPVLDVGAGAGRVALELARAGHDVTALDLDPELLAELRRARPARGARGPHRAGRRRRLRARRPAVRPDRGADADDPAAARARGPRRVPRLRPRAPRQPAAWWRSPSPRSSSRSRPTPRAAAAARHRRARRLALPLLPGRDPRARRPRRARARAQAIAPDGTTPSEDDAIALGHAERRASSRPRAAPPGSRPEPRAHHRRDRRPRRLDGGDAAWLTASCGSARCTRT